jgi:hypothetical protein
MSITLIVDVGSSSVGAALVSISKDTAPKVLLSTRSQVAAPNEPERSHSLATIITALESTVATIGSNHPAVHKTHIIFSSPWYTSETKTIKKEYDSPTVITHHIIKQLTEEAENKLTEKPKSDEKPVEHRIICTKLNGYNVPDPYNKKAKSVEVAFFASFIAKDLLESVDRVIGKYFHNRNNEISSFSLAAFSAMSGIFPAEKNYLIVDIRGEVTDLSLVNEGILIKSLSFPQGKDELARVAAQNLGQSQSGALSAIGLAFRGESDPTAKANVIKSIETFKQAWSQSYTKALQDISAGLVGATLLPPTHFLIADKDTEAFFENVMNEIKKDGSLYLLKHLNVRDFLETSSVPTDPFLALESIFVTMI